MTLRMLPMSLRDLDEVCVLESSSHTSAWSKKNFEDSLEAGHWAFTLRRLREEGPDCAWCYFYRVYSLYKCKCWSVYDCTDFFLLVRKILFNDVPVTNYCCGVKVSYLVT